MVRLADIFLTFTNLTLLSFLSLSVDTSTAALIARQNIPKYCRQPTYGSFSLYATLIDNSTDLTPLRLASYASDEYTLSVCTFNVIAAYPPISRSLHFALFTDEFVS